MPIQKKCTRQVNYSRIKIEENKRKAVLKNPNKDQYSVSKIDNCIVKEGVRCDYLISKLKSASVLVELKGSDVEHACEQLMRSVEHKSVKPLLEKKIGFLIVCSRYPRFDTFVARAKQQCARKYKAGFNVVCNQGEFEIDRLVEIDGY